MNPPTPEDSSQKIRIYNKELEPHIWDKDQNLKPEVRIDLLKIAKDFYESTDFKSEIIDILLLGSSINYNWTPESDVDVHIVIDITKEGLDNEHFRKFLDALGGKWNKEHDVSIYGHPVEVYLQDITEKNSTIEKARKHSSMFSLLNNKWLIPPEHENITLDKEAIRKSFHSLKSKIDSVINDRNFDALKDIMKYIRDYRNKGLESEDGEFSTENIVFKALRHTGVLEKLKDSINAIYDRMVSIKEHQEYIDNLVYVDTRMFDIVVEETVENMSTGAEPFILVGAVDADLHINAIKQTRKDGKSKDQHAINYDLDPLTGIDWRYRSDTNELMWWDWPSEEMSETTKKYLKDHYDIERPKYINIRSIDAQKRHFFHDLDYYYKHKKSSELEEDILFETAYNTIMEKKVPKNFIVTGQVSSDLDVNGEAYKADDEIITHGILKKKYGSFPNSMDWRYRADENMVYFLDKEPNENQKTAIFDFLKSRFGVKTVPSFVYLQRWNAYILNKSHKPSYSSGD